MPGKTSAPRRKRGAPVSSGAKKKQTVAAKKKQTVAAKKKHVREMSKAGRWTEIEKLYEKKILAKAKTYAEKNHTKKTPHEISCEILMKNGLLSRSSVVAAITTTTIGGQREMPATRVNVPRSNASIHSSSPKPLTKEQRERIKKKRQEAFERRRLPSSPPGTLTKEQQERIEQRRREALEKRRRAQNSEVCHVQPPVVIQPNLADTSRQSFQPSAAPLQNHQPPQVSRMQARSAISFHRVVTPDNLPAANPTVETEQTRPDYFWDDLEAAAEIVQWEHEHMAEAALVQPPAKTPRRENDAVRLAQQIRQAAPKTRTPPTSSISQELVAAAEIIQWEKEHEVFPDVPAFSRRDDSPGSNPEFEAPQFQLLPVQVTDDVEHERNTEAVHLQGNRAISAQNLTSNNPQSMSKSHRKRPLAASSPPALTPSSTVSCKALAPRGKTDSLSTSTQPSENQRDSAAEFIDKHFVEDKLELPVLDFLEMMLG
ncbi:hypothetical protein GN244_ATG01049 [Phytophthora infestans]|uniref:Uncharacterized protein n=1 Tax=Phytophthora infestans TaxID=4787 RepID=A0A833TBM8_PHYIN|nr:hypothetical protein GN244_ATG01049 [Phytophthora infestans]